MEICYYLINSVLRLITALQFSSFQDWFAFIGNGSEFNFTLSGEAIFPNKKAPTAEDNYGFCQVRVLVTLGRNNMLCFEVSLYSSTGTRRVIRKIL